MDDLGVPPFQETSIWWIMIVVMWCLWCLWCMLISPVFTCVVPGNLRVQVCRPYLTATFSEHGAVGVSQECCPLDPIASVLPLIHCLKGYPWKTWKDDHKMERGLSPFPVVHRALYRTILKNISQSAGHDVWGSGSGRHRTQAAQTSPGELRSHTEKRSKAPQVPCCVDLRKVTPLASKPSCSWCQRPANWVWQKQRAYSEAWASSCSWCTTSWRVKLFLTTTAFWIKYPKGNKVPTHSISYVAYSSTFGTSVRCKHWSV